MRAMKSSFEYLALDSSCAHKESHFNSSKCRCSRFLCSVGMSTFGVSLESREHTWLVTSTNDLKSIFEKDRKLHIEETHEKMFNISRVIKELHPK